MVNKQSQIDGKIDGSTLNGMTIDLLKIFYMKKITALNLENKHEM